MSARNSAALCAGAPAFLRDVTTWDNLWESTPPAERIILAAMAAALAEREAGDGEPATQASHQVPGRPADLISELESQGCVSLEALRASLRRHGVSELPAKLVDAPAALVTRGVLVQGGSGYAFADDGLRDFVRRHKPLALVKSELDHLVPLSQLLCQCAEAYYEEGRLSDAEDLLRRALSLFAGHMRARLLLGQVLRSAGRLSEAVRELSEAQRYDEQAARVPLCEALMAAAEELLRTSDRGGALALYERVLKLSPREPRAREWCIALWSERREEEAPESHLEAALEACLESQQHRVVSEAEARKRVEVETLARKAALLEQRGEWAQAQGLYQDLLERDPALGWHEALSRVKEEQRLQERYQEGVEAFRRGLWPQALAALGEVMAARPEYPERRGTAAEGRLYAVAEGLGLAVDARSLAVRAVDALSRAQGRAGSTGLRRLRWLTMAMLGGVLCLVSLAIGARCLGRPAPAELATQALAMAEHEALAGRATAAGSRLDDLLSSTDLTSSLRDLAWTRREGLRRSEAAPALPAAVLPAVTAAADPTPTPNRSGRKRGGASPLPMTVVNDTMMGARDALAACAPPDSAARLTVKLVVQPDGSVHSVTTSWPEPAAACAERVLQELRFPSPTDETTVRLSYQYLNLHR